MFDFAGNGPLISRLSKAAKAGTLAHCYLISGPAGSGRHTLANLLSAAMQCREADPPCLACNSCRKVQKGIHPDVTFVLSDKQSVGVDLIRDMRAAAYIRPNEGQRRVFIIPEAEKLTEAAQNAMLKILEEPPGAACFILLAENAGALLSTVRSRAVSLALDPVTKDEAAAWLRGHYPHKDESEISRAAAECGGLIGRAAALLEDDGPSKEAAAKAADLTLLLEKGDQLGLAEFFTGLEKTKRDEFDAYLTAFFSAAVQKAADQPTTGRRRLMKAAGEIETACAYAKANVNTAHICGFLAAALADLS